MSGQVTPEKVRELRERTGVGMGKCKEALDKSEGDMEKAIDYLRKAGIASAVKKEGREVKEGVIGSAESPKAVSLVELNAETDFVTQNERFKVFLRELAQQIAEKLPASVDALLGQPFRADPSTTVDEQRALVMQSLGENIQIKRLLTVPKSPDLSIGCYSHMGGKIVVLVVLEGGGGMETFARDIAMHIAAEAPDYLSPEQIPASIREREQEIARGQVEGKPAQVIDKIVEGKLKAFYDQTCLLHQKYVKDTSLTISALLQQESKRLQRPLAIRQFVRWKIGG
jgi:elongation factor Ts